MIFVAITALLVGVAVLWLHETAANDIERNFGQQLRAIAATSAPHIRTADLFDIQSNEDADTEAFARVRTVLERARRYNQLEEDQVYVLRRRPDGDTFEFVVMLQAQTFVGDTYEPPPNLRRWYRHVYERGRALHTEVYTDENGSFVSGIAPIIGPTGRVLAVLHVDRDLDDVLAVVRRRTAALLGGGALLIFLVVLAGVWTHRRLRSKTLELLRGTHAIQREQYDYRVPEGGDDELALLAHALNDVIAQLKERFTMLKFLPGHTKRMIAEASDRGVSLEESRRVRVVVLESDIRGFSRISEDLSPEQTIGMLNQYIRVQAEHVVAGDGSIDKYMGDAVLAVFEGDGMEQRAFDCALAIQRAVESMNEAEAFIVPIRLGVGLSAGEVVMGNMGSEDRMEHTVIGAVVNLAARLCSAARPGEIVLTQALHDVLDAEPGLATSTETLRVKGFERPLECVRVSAS